MNELLFASFPLSAVVVEIMYAYECAMSAIDLFIRVFLFVIFFFFYFSRRWTEIDLQRTTVYPYSRSMTHVYTYI
jgi:hypothetical protein